MWTMILPAASTPIDDHFDRRGSALWSPDGKKIAFVSAVFPEFSDKPFADQMRSIRRTG